jgi:hypothetical protein
MDAEQEKVLNRLIKENDVQDNTEKIKSLKHSSKIRNDVAVIQNIGQRSHSQVFFFIFKLSKYLQQVTERRN